MAQDDLSVANGSGAAVRADINNQLQALGTCMSGTSGPSTTYPYMLWADTTNNLLKQRNGANTSWSILFELTSPSIYSCRAYKSSDQSHTTSAAWEDVTFAAESFDSGSIHSTASSTELLTAPSWATKARFVAQVAFASNATGARGARLATSAGSTLTPNVAQVHQSVSAAGIGTFVSVDSGVVAVTGGSSYKIQAYQTSGGALNILGGANETWVSVEFMP